MSKRIILITYFVLSLFLTCCASIPKEAVQLSSEIGTRIIESREAHLALTRLYMKEKRAYVDEFINNKWILEYEKNIFKQEAVIKEWDRICKTNGTDSNNNIECLQFIIDLSKRVQIKINEKRKEFMEPINEMEESMIRSINNHYDELTAANATLTTFLNSATRLKEREQKALEFIDLDEKFAKYFGLTEKVTGFIAETKDSMEKIKK